jgi:hypothetical protein
MCTTPYVLKMNSHCVPLPLPGAPAMMILGAMSSAYILYRDGAASLLSAGTDRARATHGVQRLLQPHFVNCSNHISVIFFTHSALMTHSASSESRRHSCACLLLQPSQPLGVHHVVHVVVELSHLRFHRRPAKTSAGHGTNDGHATALTELIFGTRPAPPPPSCR